MLLCDFLIPPPHLMWGKGGVACYMGAIVDEKLGGTKLFVKAVTGYGGVVYPRTSVNFREGHSTEETTEVSQSAAV